MWIYVAAALTALAVGFSGGWKVATWRADSRAAQLQQQQAADQARRIEHATSAAQSFEVSREAQRVRTITVTREVQREVMADLDCSQRDLPPGLRDALTRAGSDADLAVTTGPVPSASSARTQDVGRFGDGLRRGVVGTVGVSGAAPRSE